MAKFITRFIFIIFISTKLYSSEKSETLNKNIKQFEKKYGPRAKNRLEGYYEFLNKIKTKPVDEQLRGINGFFNRFLYKKDIHNWNRSEYWANLREFIGAGAGDCEDYAIAKYFTLLQLGIPQTKLKITYSKLMDKRYKKMIPHMVLSYFEEPYSEPLILDNAIKEIIPLSKRADLHILSSPKIEKQISEKLEQLSFYKI